MFVIFGIFEITYALNFQVRKLGIPRIYCDNDSTYVWDMNVSTLKKETVWYRYDTPMSVGVQSYYAAPDCTKSKHFSKILFGCCGDPDEPQHSLDFMSKFFSVPYNINALIIELKVFVIMLDSYAESNRNRLLACNIANCEGGCH